MSNEHLCKLYSITYIKIYLYKLVYFIYNYPQIYEDVQVIINILLGEKDNNFRNIIKIYIYKLFFNFNNRNWILTNKFKLYGFDFIYEKNDQIQLEPFFINCFLPMDNEDDYHKYITQKTIFEIYLKNNFKNITSILMSFIKIFEIDIFISLSINKIISNYGFKDYLSKKSEYKHYLSLCNSIFASNNQEIEAIAKTDIKIFNNNLIKLLSLFFDYEKYNKIIKPLIEDKEGALNQELFEIILYGFRFCVQSLDINENKDLLYSSLFNEKCFQNLKKSYIPGNDDKEFFKIKFIASN